VNHSDGFRATVCLGATMSGVKLKPHVVFKGVRTGRIAREVQSFPATATYGVNQNAWMAEEDVLSYINTTIRNHVSTNQNGRSLVILDECTSHKTDSVKDAFLQMNCDFIHIPGGQTSILQPMDVSVNKPFKDRIRTNKHLWRRSRMRAVEFHSEVQNMNDVVMRPFSEQISWILRENLSLVAQKRLFSVLSIIHAWNGVSNEAIKNGWTHIGYDILFNQ
jgi:hypothetical protein